MLIECGTCRVRACADCVVSTLLEVDAPEQVVYLDEEELAALDLLAGLGMVPPLRHDRAS